MKLHPTRLQLEEFLAGDCGFLKSVGIRWHLWHCKTCRALRQEVEEERQAQLAFAAEVRRYTEAAAKAEETLKTVAIAPAATATAKEP